MVGRFRLLGIFGGYLLLLLCLYHIVIKELDISNTVSLSSLETDFEAVTNSAIRICLCNENMNVRLVLKGYFLLLLQFECLHLM